MKRKLFIAFVLVLAAGLLCCCAALADQSGTCGDGVTWAFNSATGALTISGTGAMEEYSIFNAMPWYDLKDEIRTVTVEDGVTAVSGMAFNYCSNLTGATVRASVESIGYLAFHGCTSLTRVTILNPDCVIGDIDYDVFDGCPSSLVLFGQQGSTANIYALAAGLSFAAASGTGGGDVTWTFDSVSGVLTVSGSGLMNNFSASGTPMAGLRPYITSVVIEKGVRSIGQNFFNGCSLLGSISVGDDVEKIRQNAFDGCTALTRVVLPESLYSIDVEAFRGCTGLTEVDIFWPNTNISPYAFLGCSSSLVIRGWANSTTESTAQAAGVTFEAFATAGSCGDDLTWAYDFSNRELVIDGTGPMTPFGGYDEVPWYAIRSVIRDVSIADGVTSIGKRAFAGCTALSTVTLSPMVSSIGFWAFRDCTSLLSVIVWNPDCVIGDSDHDVFQGCIKTPVLKGFTGSTAQTYAGYGNSNVTFESVGSLTGEIGDDMTYAFEPATGVLTISGTGEMDSFGYHYPWYTFRVLIKTAVIEDGVTSINSHAFRQCYEMTGITIADSVSYIGEDAFSECYALTEITIPEGVPAIFAQTFYSCSSLRSVTIPDTVITIRGDAFNGCTSLTGVIIPHSVEAIYYRAFANCDSLTDVTIFNPDCVIGDEDYDVFWDCESDPVLHSFSGSTAEAYAAGTTTCAFSLLVPAPQLFLPAGLTTLEADAFVNCSAAQAVVIPKNIQSISGNPFAGSGVLYIYGFPGTAAQTLAESDPVRFMFLPLTDAWYARLTD